MSRMLRIIAVSAMLVFCLITKVSAIEGSSVNDNAKEPIEPCSIEKLQDSLDLDSMYDTLTDEAKETLDNMGIKDIDAASLADVSASSVTSEIARVAKSEGSTAFVVLPVLVSVLMLYSLFDGVGQNLANGGTKEVLSVVCGLCISCALAVPITEVVDSAEKTITAASGFILAYVPIMVAVLVSCGKTLSGAGYYSLMIGAAQGISQLSAKVLTPMLNVFLGVSFCSAVVPSVRIDSMISMFAKFIKWMLSFSFTIFSALLTFKTLISTSIDNVSTRAVRYTMSSFIPVVGAALSEAYKTVQGSINILKNGIGVFVIFAVAAVFLPIVMKLLMWLLAVSVSKIVARVMNLSVPFDMLSGVSTVLSVLFAIIICVMALFIISTALIITVGGSNI